jgi:glycolate oxidase FAD binding subunit
MEQAYQQFRDIIASATAGHTALRIRGGGTKDWYGQSLGGAILDTRAGAGILAYEPTELVITAGSGTPLSEIEAALAERNQMLAFEPPRFGAASTIGGVVAAGLSGPRRQAVGAVRDFMLGAALMNGKGEVLRFGGQVMKNVAGYDVSRLLAGSLGTLGLILDVSLKVLPKPFAQTTLRFEMSETEALEALNRWGGQPLPISASAWHGGALMVRLSGAQAAIRGAHDKMGGEEMAQAEDAWAALRDQSNAYFAPDAALWRLSLPSTVPPLALEGEQLIEWGGAQRWLRSELPAATIRQAASRVGGHATLMRAKDKSAGVFHPLAPALAKIHRNLKNAFDPSGIFNPGRMYTDL